MTSDNAIPIQTDVPGAPRDVTRLYFDGGSAFGVQHAKPRLTWDDEQLLDAAHVGAAGRDLHPDLVAALCVRYVDLATAENIREAELQTATVRALDAERRLAAARKLIDERVSAATGARIAEVQAALTACQAALDAERQAHQGTMFARAFSDDLYVEELAERNRVARLHAEASARAAALVTQLALISAENVKLRHQIAGTTPVAVALDRAARAVVGTGAEDLTAALNDQLRRYPTLDGRFDRSEPDAADTVVMAVEDLGLGLEVGCG